MSYLTRIARIENGKPIFSNEISDAKEIGEIKLQKYPLDNVCNICLETSDLTEDHVPPKCMGNKGIFHYVNYYNYIVDREIKYFGICRNGIKYKTICKRCNNEKLKIYDDAIHELYSNFLNVNISNKLNLRLKIRPNAIIRGILGHLLSAKTSHKRTAIEDIFADAINIPTKPINCNLGFYCVTYLHNQIRIIRDLIPKDGFSLNIMKIRPLAFIITFPKLDINFPKWEQFYNCDPNYEDEMEFLGTNGFDLEFPERMIHPILFGKNGSESIIAFPQE